MSSRAHAVSTDDPATRRVERAIGVAFLVAAIAGVALLGLYLNGGQTQLEAVLLAICLGGIGIGITAWSHWLLSGTERVEARHSLDEPRRRGCRVRRRDGVHHPAHRS